MNQENLNFLQDRLKYLGFGDHSLLNDQLEEKIAQQLRSFELWTDAFFEEKIKTDAQLSFFKMDNADIYVLNCYTATIKYDEEPARNKMRKFTIFKGTGATFKQAFNLLDGRAAYIDHHRPSRNERYYTWAQLDFTEMDTTGNYKLREFDGYDLEKVLALYEIQELKSEASKERLISALERGNLHPVFFEHKDKVEERIITADPINKSIKIYSSAPRAVKKKRTERTRISKGALLAVADPGPGEKSEPEEEPIQPEETEQVLNH